MRSILSISLLVLLLYHMCRVGVVLLCFEHLYSTASPVMQDDQWVVVKVPLSLPYTSHWEELQGKKGLVRMNGQFYNITHQRYENDTLYTELKTNTTAREHFFTLAQQAQQFQPSEEPSKTTPLSRLLQTLNQWAASYVETAFAHGLYVCSVCCVSISYAAFVPASVYSLPLSIPTPPPEAV